MADLVPGAKTKSGKILIELPRSLVEHIVKDMARVLEDIAGAKGTTPRAVIADYQRMKRAGDVETLDLPITDWDARVIKALAPYVPDLDLS